MYLFLLLWGATRHKKVYNPLEYTNSRNILKRILGIVNEGKTTFLRETKIWKCQSSFKRINFVSAGVPHAIYERYACHHLRLLFTLNRLIIIIRFNLCSLFYGTPEIRISWWSTSQGKNPIIQANNYKCLSYV